MGKRKLGGAVGVFPEDSIEWKHPIREGRMYRVSPFGGGIPMFDPKSPGWEGMNGSTVSAQIDAGDAFLAVERVAVGRGTQNELDEVWLVLCKGVLGKVLLSEWVLREVIEVTE